MRKFVKDFGIRQGLGRLSGARSCLPVKIKSFAALRAHDSASCSALSPQRAGIYPAVEMNLEILLPFGRYRLPSGEVLDACAARSKAEPVMGLRPLLGPLASPPKHPQAGLSITSVWRGQRGCSFRSFPPSLRSVRRSPFAPRKCGWRICFG